MHPQLQTLQPYPFERLSQLMAGIRPPNHLKPITLTIGEPKHAAPEIALRAYDQVKDGLSLYPSTQGTDAFRDSIAHWADHRFQLQGTLDPHTMVLPINGTREGLFAIAQVLLGDNPNKRRVLMPNPFYQIYEGATLLAGGIPTLMDLQQERHFEPQWDQISDQIYAETAFVYVCSPNNPTGSVVTREQWKSLLERAREFDFVVVADECYSEIYFDEAKPPLGALAAAQALGRGDWKRLVVFGSLSKRSNCPGLRSGFVAGDAALIKPFLLYRTYHGSAMSPVVASASIAAWRDEAHVIANRQLYREKFDAVSDQIASVMPTRRPEAGFYLWAAVPGGDDTTFVRELYRQYNVLTLPGSFLARDADGINPGRGFVRLALVEPLAACQEGARRITQFFKH
jgi:N-succinyldiaminopimelate aminotransferase